MSTLPALTPTPMDKIVTTLTVTNRIDRVRAENGDNGCGHSDNGSLG